MDSPEATDQATSSPASISPLPDLTPSPPLLIRLVSPPTPTSPSPAFHDLNTRQGSSGGSQEVGNTCISLRNPATPPERLEDDHKSSSTLSVDHSTQSGSLHSSRPRATPPAMLNFSSLVSSTNSRSSTVQHSLPSNRPSFKSNSKQMHKIRSPSLAQSKSSNVGMVKRVALGLARKVSQSVKSRISHSNFGDKNERTEKISGNRVASMRRKINETEFPNAGALSEARRMRAQHVEESGKKGGKKRESTGGKESHAPATPYSRVSLGHGTGSRRRQSSPHPLPFSSNTPSTSRKVKLKPRVSFPRSSPSSLRSAKKKVINRPRPVPRRRAGSRTPIFEAEEEEWLDEAPEVQITKTRPSSRLSISSVTQRLPFLRSYIPASSSLSRSTDSTSSSSNPPFRLNVALSPPQSLDPSDESFQCRGEFPFTPSPDQHLSPIPQPRILRGRSSSPRNAVYIPRTSSTRDSTSVSPISEMSAVQRKLQKERRREASISPGDLTRFLEELVLEQEVDEDTGAIDGRAAEEEDVFADADEPEVIDGTVSMEAQEHEEDSDDYEFEISRATTNRSTVSSRSFVLPLPPPRRQSRSAGSQIQISPNASPLSTHLCAPSLLHLSPSAPIPSPTTQSSNEEDGIKLLSASRETFVRGQLVRKGSLSSLGLLTSLSPRSPSVSSAPSPSPSSTISPEKSDSARSSLTEKSVFAQLQARPRWLTGSTSASPKLEQSQKVISTAEQSFFEFSPPHSAPLPQTLPLNSPSLSTVDGGGRSEHFITAPSTPYDGSSPPRFLFSATSSSFSSSTTKSRNDGRSPLASIFTSKSRATESSTGGDRSSGSRSRSESRKRRRETMLPLDIYQDLEESGRTDEGLDSSSSLSS